MRNARLDESQAVIKIAGRNINNLSYADDTTFMAENKEKLKNLLMKLTVENEKVGLKLNIQKTKIMASGFITSWKIDGETVETVTDFIFGGSKITESWTVKKAEHRKIVAFELWCWRRLLRVPWSARRSNQSILKEISPGCSLEGLMLKLKLQYFGHFMQRVDSLEKTLVLVGMGAGGEGDDRQWDGWMASLTRWTWVWVDSGSWWWTGRPGVLQFMGSQRVGHNWATELKWTENHCRWLIAAMKLKDAYSLEEKVWPT